MLQSPDKATLLINSVQLCSICAASKARHAAPIFIQQTPAPTFFQQVLLGITKKKSSNFMSLLTSLNDDVDRMKKSSNKVVQSHANRKAFTWVRKSLKSCSQDIPYQYDAFPCELTITDSKNDLDMPDKDLIINFLCKNCEVLLRKYSKYEQLSEQILCNILKIIFKPWLFIEGSTLPDSDVHRVSEDKPNQRDIVETNNGQVSPCNASRAGASLTETIPNRKRGRPRKHEFQTKKTSEIVSFSETSKSTCPFCFKSYSIVHSTVHNCLPYRNSLHCTTCNVFSSSYVRLEKHLEIYHRQKKHLLCDVNSCNQKFISQPAFTWHKHFHMLDKRSHQMNDLTSIEMYSNESKNTVNDNMYYSLLKFSDENVIEDECVRSQDIKAHNYDKDKAETCKERPGSEREVSLDSNESVYLLLPENGSEISVSNLIIGRDGCDASSLLSGRDWSNLEDARCQGADSNNFSSEVIKIAFDLSNGTTLPAVDEANSQRDHMSSDLSQKFNDSPESFTLTSCHVISRSVADVTSCVSCDAGSLGDNAEKITCAVSTSSCNVGNEREQAVKVEISGNDDHFEQQDRLVEHICTKHRVGEQEFECPVCDKPFHSIPVLISHLNQHDGTELCKCLICSSNVQNEMIKSGHCVAEGIEISNSISVPMSFEPSHQFLPLNLVEQQTEKGLSKDYSYAEIESKLTNNQDKNGSSSSNLLVQSREFFSNHKISFCDKNNALLDSNRISYSYELNKHSSLHLDKTVFNLSTTGDTYTSSSVCSDSEDLYNRVGTFMSVDNASTNPRTMKKHLPSSLPHYRSNNPVLCYHNSGTSHSSQSTSAPSAGGDCVQELDEQRLSCDTCGSLFSSHSALKRHTHVCQTMGDKLDTPFHDVSDNFLPATENLSVVNALESSSGSVLTPIERLIGTVDDMDYFS